jgi:uncharacterized membrane protein
MLFTPAQERQIIAEIRAAELLTTGEIRVFVEDYCFCDTPLERASEIFDLHGMQATKHRNGVLIYIAERSRQFAVFGDAGLYAVEPPAFWQSEKQSMRAHFQADNHAEGVIQVIQEVGAKLALHFPDDGTRINELSDDIMYG